MKFIYAYRFGVKGVGKLNQKCCGEKAEEKEASNLKAEGGRKVK